MQQHSVMSSLTVPSSPPPPAAAESRKETSVCSGGGGEDRNHYSEYWNLFQSPVNNQIGTASLAMIVFYMVSGGPFGLEGTVRAGGFLYSILGFLFMPIIYSVPEGMYASMASISADSKFLADLSDPLPSARVLSLRCELNFSAFHLKALVTAELGSAFQEASGGGAYFQRCSE